MARIRSVHPGLFTDIAFVSCSPLARLLAIGLWTEADDQGLFVWEPVGIKMRIFPADNLDANALLEELVAHNIIAKFSHGGREYGAVRNFRRYQRPKKPNSVHFMPAELRTYVGLSGISSEPYDDEEEPIPKKGEIAPQMEDGGGEKRIPSSSAVTPQAALAIDLKKSIMTAFHRANSPNFPDTSRVDRWLAQGYSPAICLAVITELVRKKPDISSLTYFDGAIADAHKAKAPPGFNGHAPEKTYDLGAGVVITEANLIRQIEKPLPAWVQQFFGSDQGFREAVRRKAPHLAEMFSQGRG